MFRDEFSDFRVENGVEKGPLKRNRRNSTISAPCQTRMVLRLGGTECEMVHVVSIMCVVKMHDRALKVHKCELFSDLENLIFLPRMNS